MATTGMEMEPDCQVVPLEVSTWPDDPGETNETEDAPPSRTALLVRKVLPVPPLATGTAPTPKEMVGVDPPEDCKGLEALTLVTGTDP